MLGRCQPLVEVIPDSVGASPAKADKSPQGCYGKIEFVDLPSNFFRI